MEYNKTIATAFSQVVNDIKQIIDKGRNAAYAAVDATMIATYWNIGRRIVEEEQHGQERAQYGKGLIKTLAKDKDARQGTDARIRERVQPTVSCLLPQVLPHDA